MPQYIERLQVVDTKALKFKTINVKTKLNFKKLIPNFLIAVFVLAVSSELIAQDKKVRYLQNVFENITIQKDVVFGESFTSKETKQTLALDIYSPKNDTALNRPVIVWIHGGGFRYGNDKTQSYIVEMAKRFTKKGYVCLSIDYRVRENPKDDFTGTISDAVADAIKALQWLREHSESLNIDTSKIIIGGGSAGGILGSSLCFNNWIDKNDKAGIIGFVNLWGTPDTEWGKLDVDKNDPPTIIVHGTEDQSVSYNNSVALVKRLKANNIKHELVTFEGAGHTPVKHMDEFELKIANFLYDIMN